MHPVGVREVLDMSCDRLCIRGVVRLYCDPDHRMHIPEVGHVEWTEGEVSAPSKDVRTEWSCDPVTQFHELSQGVRVTYKRYTEGGRDRWTDGWDRWKKKDGSGTRGKRSSKRPPHTRLEFLPSIPVWTV